MASEVSPERLAKALVSRGVARDAAVGWAVREQGRWVTGAGRASAVDAVEVDPVFDLASLTKPMTAFAFVRSGILARTDGLGDALEEARGTASERVTLELLLAHRAGLEAHLPLYEPLLSGGTVERTPALRRIADARRADAIGPAPPEGFAPVYSDLGFALVGEALARAERARDAGEVIERLVAAAIGRDDLGTARCLAARSIDFAARVRPTEVVPWRGGVVSGAVHDENAWALTGSGGSGHAGMFGTLEAVLAFGGAALDAIDHGTGPLAPAPGHGDLGWLVRPRPGGSLRAGFDGKSETGSSAGERAGPRTFGHLGFTGTSLWIDPDAHAVVAVLTNRVHPTRDNVAIRAARPVIHDALFALAAERRARSGASDAARP
ncbi:MAG TPA: serine hydrolase domain-containing protein [Labilithrix sp.]|nr:serine hydrolase domain-containing protein [Labilithrix sp.]